MTTPAWDSLMISSCSCYGTYLIKESSIPILYKYLFMIVNDASFMARNFFLFVGRSSEDLPSSKKLEIYYKYLGATLTLNKCAYGRSLLMPIRSSPVSSHDRWSGWTFFFPSRMIMPNSNSWNNSNHPKKNSLMNWFIDQLFQCLMVYKKCKGVFQ